MDDNVQISWERFLHPETLRTNLIVASVYITAFEMLKDSIIGQIKGFFSCGYSREKGFITDDKYKKEVLMRDKSPLYASLYWLQENNVIELFNKIKDCRNELAHDIIDYITSGIKSDPMPLFHSMFDLLNKIEKWWIINVEIPTNPDIADKEIDENGIIPGPIMTLRLLTDIALGAEKESEWYFREFRERTKGI
jgi:hypothetical protein